MRFVKMVVLTCALMPAGAFAADDAVIAELSLRSRLPLMEILPALDHCTRSQHTQNVCAYYDAVAAELALDALVGEVGFPPADAYAAMKADTQEACVAQAEAQLQDRALLPMTISRCIADRFQGQRGQVMDEGGLFPFHATGGARSEDCACVSDSGAH